MDIGKVCQCFDIGVTAGILSPLEADEAKSYFNRNNDFSGMRGRIEAAEYLGIHVSTLDRKAKAGIIKRFNTPVGPRYRQSDLDKLITTNLNCHRRKLK